MNKRLQAILNLLQQSESLTPEEKKSLADAVNESDKEITITEFKLERTEKVKRTTAILLEETITELEQKRKSVEAQNRELELEAALERVRGRTMAMQRSDELVDVASILFQQVKALGVPQWNCGFNIWDIGDKEFTYYPGSPDGKILPTPCKIPLTEHPVFISFDESRKRGDELFVYEKEGEYQAEHYKYMLNLPGVGDLLQSMLDAGFQLPTFQIDHVVNFSHGNLIFITYEHFPEMHVIFKRFGKVFEQTYTRFLDLQQAESQAREAQIQLALERVRARTMAMQHSNELRDAASVLFQQVKELGIDAWTCGYNIWDEDKKATTAWLSRGIIQPPFKVPLTENPTLMHFYEAAQRGESLFVEEVAGEALIELYRYLGTLLTSEGISDEIRKPGYSPPTFQVHNVAYFSFGYLLFVTYKHYPEAHDIFKRFAVVFEQTYTRFLDLQKAEAQAREAQIQLALERVRARTMAMQHSNELPEAANLLFQQVQSLGMRAWSAGYCIWDKDQKSVTAWMSSEGVLQAPFRAPLTEDPSFIHFREAYERGETFFVEEIGGEELVNHYKYVRSQPVGGEIQDAIIEAGHQLPTFQIFHCAYFLQGFLLFITYERVPEAWDIFKRFAKVFEQTYTRFLDLQKAEAQAREGQIETALEKIRSRSLAMHHSGELKDVVAIVFEKMTELNVVLGTIAIQLFDQSSMSSIFWPANNLDEPRNVKLPYDERMMNEDTYNKDSWHAKIRGENIINKEYSIEQKTKFFDYAYAHNDLSVIQEVTREFIAQSRGNIVCLITQKNSALFADSWNGQFYSEESIKILTRASKVFEQAYVRFLDLQKAEAQARESQIQLALERVRARTMAMHHSSELSEAASLLFEQLTQLGAALWTCGFAIYEKDKVMVEKWMCSPDSGKMLDPLYFPYTGDALEQTIYENWKNGAELYSEVSEGAEILENQEKLNIAVPALKAILESVLAAGIPFPKWVKAHAAFHQYGYLLIITTKPFEESEVFVRFAKVFEQTYTRFLDLQKAEAQAREAQIEAALEKVRSRSLAMYYSEELKEVVATIFEKLKELGLVFDGGAGVKIFSEGSKDSVLWVAVPDTMSTPPSRVNLPYVGNAMHVDIWHARENGTHLFNRTYSLEEKNEYFNHVFAHNDYKAVPQLIRDYIVQTQSYTGSEAYEKNTAVVVSSFSGELISEKQFEILKRFSRVFEQAYTRFLDLQKAEAQAREAQIEAALEKVRSRSMGMQKSIELREVVSSLFNQMRKLGFDLKICNILLVDATTLEVDYWLSMDEQEIFPENYHIPYFDHPMYHYQLNAWRDQSPFAEFELSGQIKASWEEYLMTRTPIKTISESIKDMMRKLEKIFLSSVAIKNGLVQTISVDHLSADSITILQRFAKVFEQSYTRFLDLQKAEAQAREAQIEAALERVRARTMAMQKSDELADVAGLMFQQVRELGFTAWTTGFNVWSDDNNTYTDYVTSPLGGFIEPYTIDTTVFPSFKEISDAKKSGQEFYVQYLEGEVLKETYLELSKFGDKGQYVKMREGGFEFPTRQFDHFVFLSNISLMFITYDPVPEAHELFKRFGKVFEQTYTRFLDLQKAEAQAREAQIEAALERVRARTMAMQHSSELGETSFLLAKQVRALGIQTWGCAFSIFDEDQKTSTEWFSNDNGYLPTYKTPREGVFLRYYEAAQRGESLHVEEFEGETCVAHYKYLSTLPVLGDILKKYSESGVSIPTYQIDHVAYFKYGYLLFVTYQPIPEAHDIFQRFAKVFEQTYTRFLDLQKAEAQAREAKIEASLERVRGKAMAMHSSADLAATIGIFYRELESFSITPRRCGVGLLDKETRVAELSTMNTTDNGGSIEIVGTLQMQGHPVLESVYDNWILQQEYHPVLRGSEIKEYYQLLRPQISFPEYPNDAVQFGYFFSFPEGAVYAWTEKELPEDELKIYRRFTSVLSLTYKRYKDLKDAETRAKEAVKQATLDRVRAEIASMRTKQDLDRITPLIWNELTILGVPFVRCGVFIMDDKHQLVHTFLSTPEGKAIGAFQLDYETANLKEAIRHWHDNQVYVTQWGEKEFGEMADTLLKQGSIVSLDQYLKPTGVIHLHFLPFLQGMLYVGNITPLQQEDLHLVQSLADAFSTAYARYEDFNKLEAAKQQVDQALVELKRTQQQLVQSEKMASLGELTAGIAHEIQNPLNFVNNFSEVSNELIDEMVEEVKKGNFDEAKIIANDLKQNLEKITHHGKRADGIVKSMLQHSRSSSGQREPTDINVLCDEYLRLSYHGLRAKDKSFNATFETDFDSTLEKINVIPQDIGRVILNLINNAFYAVNERKRLKIGGYEPKITVVTKSLPGKTEVRIKDNGIGISERVKEKIFQPFFTTKPTGQGTGLGLSLSYDIVKAHGGTLEMYSTEGLGSEFIIQLPT